MEKQRAMKWLLFLLLIPAALGANNRENITLTLNGCYM